MMVRSPILFIIFNRLDTTKRVFEEIRKAKPERLYISGDGPRDEEERKKTDEVRDYVMKNIDWDCVVKSYFRNHNLGCKYAVSGAIDWFFEKEKEGIILEDDCLPSQSFFKFCDTMLERHRNDDSIMHISGTNIEGVSNIKDDYFLSKTFNVWGWATWKRAWDYYDVDMNKYTNRNSMKFLDELDYGIFEKIVAKRKYRKTKNGEIDTWDYQWDFDCKYNNGYSIIPRKNLIMNIGLGNGTHTTNKSDKKKIIRLRDMHNFNPNSPKVKMNRDYDVSYARFFKTKLLNKLIKKIRLQK